MKRFLFKIMVKIFLACAFASLAFMACSTKNTDSSSQQSSRTNMINNDMYMLVGTYTSGDSKGIYVYKLDTVNGTSQYISMVEVENPSYLTFGNDQKFVYSVSEGDIAETSAANAFSFDKKTGELVLLNSQPTNGGAPCYISADSSGKHVVTANYVGGSVSVFDVNEDGSLTTPSQVIQAEGKGAHPKRQTQPHIHCTVYTPDGNYLLVSDLGTDRIHKFDVNPAGEYLTKGTPDAFQVKAGSGPRHIDFHPNGKFAYLINEIGGDVVAFEYADGILKEIQSIQADTLNAQGSGDIHVSPDGRFVYASNRLKGDGIAIFSIDQQSGKLTKVGYQPTGIHPRNFAITPNGKLLLAACRDSNSIEVFAIDPVNGLLHNTGNDIKLDKPVCIKFASIE